MKALSIDSTHEEARKEVLCLSVRVLQRSKQICVVSKRERRCLPRSEQRKISRLFDPLWCVASGASFTVQESLQSDYPNALPLKLLLIEALVNLKEYDRASDMCEYVLPLILDVCVIDILAGPLSLRIRETSRRCAISRSVLE